MHICHLKTADILLNKLINQLSKLYKHMDSVAIVLKQVEKFLIISLKINKNKFEPVLQVPQGKKTRKIFFSEKSV